MPNQALEQTRDSVLRYGEVVGCELLNFFVRQQEAQSQSRVGATPMVIVRSSRFPMMPSMPTPVVRAALQARWAGLRPGHVACSFHPEAAGHQGVIRIMAASR
jgi:hypothetical protein